jgi:hypothetical protein
MCFWYVKTYLLNLAGLFAELVEILCLSCCNCQTLFARLFVIVAGPYLNNPLVKTWIWTDFVPGRPICEVALLRYRPVHIRILVHGPRANWREMLGRGGRMWGVTRSHVGGRRVWSVPEICIPDSTTIHARAELRETRSRIVAACLFLHQVAYPPRFGFIFAPPTNPNNNGAHNSNSGCLR